MNPSAYAIAMHLTIGIREEPWGFFLDAVIHHTLTRQDIAAMRILKRSGVEAPQWVEVILGDAGGLMDELCEEALTAFFQGVPHEVAS